jgi:hypothetical protein
MSYPPPYQPYGYGAPPRGVLLPPPPTRRRSRRTTVAWVTGGVVLAAVLVAVVVLGGLRLGRDAGDSLSGAAAAAVTTSPPVPATGLGRDPGLDGYAQQCHDGVMSACDDLDAQSPRGSTYEQYGRSCGGRVKAFDISACTDLGGATAPPSDPSGLGQDAGLDGYAQRCYDGLLSACDDLYSLSPPMSRYEQYGRTCGGRVPTADVASCEALDGD